MSPRLARLADCVIPRRPVADIATDHAWLAIDLVRSGRVPRAIASDLKEAPLAGARANVIASGVEDAVELRLGSGLEAIEDDEVSTVVIAGIGGALCGRLLKTGIPAGVRRLVLQVNAQQAFLRRSLQAIGWPVIDEWMDESDGRFFVTMVAEPERELRRLSDADEEFGPFLRRKRGETYLRWLDHELERTQRVVDHLPPGSDNAAAREARRRLAALMRERCGPPQSDAG